MLDVEALQEALAGVETGVFSWDIGHDTIAWSDGMCALFGRASDSAPTSYRDYLALLPPEESGGVRAVVEQAVRTAKESGASTSYVLEHRVVLPDGTVRWLEGRGRVFVGEHGLPHHVTGTSVDVSARRAAAEELRRTHEAARLFTELASDYVYVADFRNPNLFPEIVAGSFERTTGMTPAAVEARGGWWQVIHPDDRAALGALVPLLMQGKPSVNEYRITDGDGQVRWLRDSVRPVLDPVTGELVKLMGGVQDITDHKRLEEQLLQAQKLEAVARLSGGIAHDFNNLLAVVMGSVALLQPEVHSARGRESCDAIMGAAKQGAELTRSLLMFARRDAGTPQLVELLELVRGALPMLARAVGEDIQVTVEGTEPSALVRIDPGQAQLVLLNLAVNARDAMPNGGAIRIVVRSDSVGARDGVPGELAPGAYARVSVEDEGVGIPPELMSRVFEPFFTTKGLGKGTGLGLAACHGIVQHAGGAFQVASVAGRGATFSFFLPQVSGAKPAVTSLARVSPGGTERILLVEDAESLRVIFVRSLSARGYDVLTADTAEAALILLETTTVALLISDVVLPGMHGVELVKRARARTPDLPVLLISGYAGPTTVPEDVPILGKPFTIDRLARRIRDLLDGTDRGSDQPAATGFTSIPPGPSS